ncbi:MAG TPA: ABC transporter ATP-binding protein [Thermoanaerobaculia bacterium]|nr:ABC transporter ATP-binding protein [Thermoanaerobaculia bacterium]
MSTLSNLVRILSPRERRQMMLLMPLLAVTAVVEVAGIASITPFLALVADPEAVERHELLRRIYEMGGFADTRGFLIALGLLMFGFVVLSNALSAFATWAVLRFAWMRSHTIALRILRGYLGRPYLFFLEHHSADLGKNLLTEVNQVVAGTVVPAMKAVAGGIAALGVFALLFYIDPLLATLTALVMGGAYGTIFFSIRRRQRRLGEVRLEANRGRFEALAEAFGGIKEVKLLGRERAMERRFAKPSYAFVGATASNAVVAQLPRYALEAVAFGGILLMVLYLLGRGEDFESVLPVLGLYAFAGYRLMPSLQQIFHGMTSVRFNASALEHLIADLPPPGTATAERPAGPPMRLARSLRLCGVDFHYPTAKQPLFNGLDLEIEAFTTVAFVGQTGSGKSTLADLVLGLLRPDAGAIEVDDVPLDDSNLARWQANLGYVPQSIFLTDDTVTRNIAFGLPDEQIDREAVERAARAACIDEFITGEMPRGYDTLVGERGVRLSGGQRQRIGIARALYHDPEVLVFDEATSSLDGGTEELVMQAVRDLASSRTIVLIAHRLSTVRDCDRIFLLSAGEVVDTGTYDELIDGSARFRALALTQSDA